MNWVYALQAPAECRARRRRLDPLVASLRPGQQLLYIRPLTEGANELEGAVDVAGAPARGAVGRDPQDDVDAAC